MTTDTDKTRESRLLRQSRALVELARTTFRGEDADAAIREITRVAAETLACERASVWLYTGNRSAIRCSDLYERSSRSHSRGQELAAASHPAYFRALESERTIAAHDARTDPRTREFLDDYLVPLGITAMLDAPIRAGGRMLGVVCHEHVGSPRRWSADERSFAGSIADAVSLALEESERKRAEAALRESEERYRRIVETALEGIWVIDASGVTTYANPRMAEMLGYRPEELLGKNAFDLVHPEDLGRASEQWALRMQGASARLEFLFVKKDGSPLWASCSAAPLFDEAGRSTGAFAMITDVTELKRAEAERAEILARERAARAEAEAANRTKDEFLATVSHELRTPLNAMVGWVHLLRAGSLDAATTARALETIERNIRAQAQIIDDILDVSRIVRGSLTLHVRLLDLAPLVEQTVESLRPALQGKGLHLRSTAGTSGGHVHGDPDRLQQVVWNLLANAIKFTPPGGSVEVRLETEDGQVRLTVADTGQGIDREFLPHVFERFRQADSSISRVHGGLGLGLAIVRHIVELHGGTVTAESAGGNQGARFTVLLPAAAPAGLVDSGPAVQMAASREESD